MIDPKMLMMLQGGGGGMGGGGGGGMGGGGGLEQLLQMAMPLLDRMGPQTKMQLGAALQTPGVQNLVSQVMQNPQMLAAIWQQFAPMLQGGGMPPGGGMQGPATDGDLGAMDVQQQEMVRGNLPPIDRGGMGPYSDQEPRPMSTEEELMMIQQLMGKQQDMPMSTGKKKASDDDSDDE